MSVILGHCCNQCFRMGDKIECISSGDCGWIYKIKVFGIKNSFVIKWTTGLRVGDLQQFSNQKYCDDFKKCSPFENDKTKCAQHYYVHP